MNDPELIRALIEYAGAAAPRSIGMVTHVLRCRAKCSNLARGLNVEVPIFSYMVVPPFRLLGVALLKDKPVEHRHLTVRCCPNQQLLFPYHSYMSDSHSHVLLCLPILAAPPNAFYLVTWQFRFLYSPSEKKKI
jgi:hypothetical protein